MSRCSSSRWPEIADALAQAGAMARAAALAMHGQFHHDVSLPSLRAHVLCAQRARLIPDSVVPDDASSVGGRPAAERPTDTAERGTPAVAGCRRSQPGITYVPLGFTRRIAAHTFLSHIATRPSFLAARPTGKSRRPPPYASRASSADAHIGGARVAVTGVTSHHTQPEFQTIPTTARIPHRKRGRQRGQSSQR